jgi:tRNA A-37 threonylcarbamoyl transferase component Bud32
MRLLVLYAASAEWKGVAEHIEQFLTSKEFRAVKENSRTRAGFINCSENVAFVKKVTNRGFLNGLIGRLFRSRAARALRGASILAEAGFRYPRPFAAIELRSKGSVRATYVITEALQTPRIVSELAIGRRRDRFIRKKIAYQVANEIRRLHESGIYTLDMQETNLMIEPHGEGFAIYFVDLEDFRKTSRVSMRQRMENLVHLDRSIGRFASKAHRLRFFYYYLGQRPDRAEARRLLGFYLQTRARIERKPRRLARKAKPVNNGFAPASPLD